jgi:UDP-galactopyranose mutase
MDKMSKEEMPLDSTLEAAGLGFTGIPSEKVFRISTLRVQRKSAPQADLVCFSHLRWDFVFQRPHHLMSRFSKERRVFYVEEPVEDADAETARIEIRRPGPESLWVVVPHLPANRDGVWQDATLRRLIDEVFVSELIVEPVLWYYTPMAIGFTSHLRSLATIYDCMDELANFRFASAVLKDREAVLFRKADLVFTGGQSLHEAKRGKHSRVHCFPSSVDIEHFKKARQHRQDPRDQALLPHPRLGYAGVIDERIDLGLLQNIAAARPDWQLVLVGPVCMISPESLPRLHNIHYLGARPYSELPAYLGGWDVALLPFARNAATKYISPSKTPEYLAAGRPVVSTPIRDVVRPYGDRGFVYIADHAKEFIRCVDKALELRRNGRTWLEEVDTFLSLNSWDRTFKEMRNLLSHAEVEQERKSAMA